MLAVWLYAVAIFCLFAPRSIVSTFWVEHGLVFVQVTRTGRTCGSTYLPVSPVICRNTTSVPSPKFELRKCFDSIPGPERYDNILLMPANICHFPTYSYHKLHFVHVHLVMRSFYFGPSFGILPSRSYCIPRWAICPSTNKNDVSPRNPEHRCLRRSTGPVIGKA